MMVISNRNLQTSKGPPFSASSRYGHLRKVSHGPVEPQSLARHVLNGRQIKSDFVGNQKKTLETGKQQGSLNDPRLGDVGTIKCMQMYGDFSGIS